MSDETETPELSVRAKLALAEKLVEMMQTENRELRRKILLMERLDASTGHGWPRDQRDHVYDKWTTNTAQQGLKRPTQSRRCVHPDCRHFETRTAP